MAREIHSVIMGDYNGHLTVSRAISKECGRSVSELSPYFVKRGINGNEFYYASEYHYDRRIIHMRRIKVKPHDLTNHLIIIGWLKKVKLG